MMRACTERLMLSWIIFAKDCPTPRQGQRDGWSTNTRRDGKMVAQETA